MSVPERAEWLGWSVERAAQWVAERGPVVMGWPFNGTRRWYIAQRHANPDFGDYLSAVIRRQGELHRMIFAHGVSALVTPGFGMETLKRGREYTKYVLSGLLQLAEDEVYRRMFAEGLRLRFYGDYEEKLDAPDFRPMLDACAELESSTASGGGPLLLIGLFADDPYPSIARLSVEFAEKHGRPPDREELVEAYYGVRVPDLSLYVGFEQPQMFDVPLITNGLENLYTTLNPSPDLTERQLREILHDHLVTRQAPPVDYENLSPEALRRMISYNESRGGQTLGVGRIDPLTGLWEPVLPG